MRIMNISEVRNLNRKISGKETDRTISELFESSTKTKFLPNKIQKLN